MKSFIKLFPEVFALPLAFIGLVIVQGHLSISPEANAVVSNDWVQMPLISALILMFANAVSHGAIKYNQPQVWQEYKKWINNQGGDPKGYFNYLVLYLVSFVIIMRLLLR